ncbi:MAG: Gfo/Idh/MocA family oxidoreductase [Patescibacteria group bacterium]
MTRLALFGHGRWGKAILRTLEGFPEVSVTVVGRGETPGANVDGAIIATPVSTHAELALPLIERGVPLLIEKPLTASVEEANRLEAAAEKADTLVQVGHIHLHNPAFMKVQELLPTLGRIRYLSFEGMNNGPARNDASVLWDWLPHPLSMTLRLVEAAPLSVQAWGINCLRPDTQALYDIGIVRYVFEGGASLLCSVNWLSPEKRTKMTIVGETSSLVHTDTDAQKLVLYEGMGPAVDGMQVTHQAPSVSYPAYGGGWPLEHELHAFIDALQKGSRDRSELAFGARIVRLIAAAHTSIETEGRAVTLNI